MNRAFHKVAFTGVPNESTVVFAEQTETGFNNTTF